MPHMQATHKCSMDVLTFSSGRWHAAERGEAGNDGWTWSTTSGLELPRKAQTTCHDQPSTPRCSLMNVTNQLQNPAPK